jgi:hypothetical protein
LGSNDAVGGRYTPTSLLSVSDQQIEESLSVHAIRVHGASALDRFIMVDQRTKTRDIALNLSGGFHAKI